jgi:hypothetical protein
VQLQIARAFPAVSTKKFCPPQFSHKASPVFYCGKMTLAAECFQSMREMSGMPVHSYSGAGCQQILEGELLEGFSER